jgi:hypothetical protein
MAVKAYKAIGKNPLSLSSLITNWETHTIQEIEAIDREIDSCPTDFEPMISRIWPGTY